MKSPENETVFRGFLFSAIHCGVLAKGGAGDTAIFWVWWLQVTITA